MQIPDNIIPEQMLANNLLVANPSLRGGCFDRSVIYMIEHSDKNGSLGLILNHPTGKSVGQLIASDSFSKLSHLEVNFGGPIESDQLHFAVFEWISNTLVCSTKISREKAIIAMLTPGKKVRAYAGHSGWSAGQLHEEIEAQTWISASPKESTLRDIESDDFWAKTLRGLSPYHHILSLAPANPYLN